MDVNINLGPTSGDNITAEVCRLYVSHGGYDYELNRYQGLWSVIRRDPSKPNVAPCREIRTVQGWEPCFKTEIEVAKWTTPASLLNEVL